MNDLKIEKAIKSNNKKSTSNYDESIKKIEKECREDEERYLREFNQGKHNKKKESFHQMGNNYNP